MKEFQEVKFFLQTLAAVLYPIWVSSKITKSILWLTAMDLQRSMSAAFAAPLQFQQRSDIYEREEVGRPSPAARMMADLAEVLSNRCLVLSFLRLAPWVKLGEVVADFGFVCEVIGGSTFIQSPKPVATRPVREF